MTSPAAATPAGMELLAPAGSLEVFQTAIAAGADAVYVGAPALNARALGHDFTRAELAGMTAYAHDHGRKLYVAMNSLAKEQELGQAVATLAMLAELRVDALILQDLGVWRLARQHFPELPLHASTLMGAHNSLAVRQLAEMGFSRVVLARELSIREISAISRRSPVELEVFVHGALCFSYSGLCLFSSFLGGKSGLRGRCVQPCRRRYTWAEAKGGRQQSGYFFSMNDLCGLGLLPQLRQAGVISLKIEGRLRSAHYVGAVVAAYRLALDSLEADEASRAATMREAEQLIASAMGRKICPGYFLGPRPVELISPHHSGNIGLFLGQVAKLDRQGLARLTLRQPVRIGDRLRLHQEASGERIAFTLKLLKIAGLEADGAAAGTEVAMEVAAGVRAGDSLYQVDVSQRRAVESKELTAMAEAIEPSPSARERQRVARVLTALGLDLPPKRKPIAEPPARTQAGPDARHRARASTVSWWLKIDDLKLLKARLPVAFEHIAVVLDRQTLRQYLRAKATLRSLDRKIVWSLPPIIQEADQDFYARSIRQLTAGGCRAWQLGHIGQLQFFAKGPPVRLYADYTLNALNTQALAALRELGFKNAQVLVETDRDNLQAISARKAGAKTEMALGLTIYGSPPLFTSRATPEHFRYDRPLVSPKGEELVLRKHANLTLALPLRPFSLIPALPELTAMGLSYAVVDLCHLRLREKDLEDLGRHLLGKPKGRRLSTFNYSGHLQ